MGDYTPSGFWFPTDGDLLKPLEKNFEKQARSFEKVFEDKVGMTRVTPSAVSSGYINAQGDIVITGEEDGQNTVRLTDAFDWDIAREYELTAVFNQCYQNESFSFRLGTGMQDDGGPNYSWSRLKTREGAITNDWGRYDDGAPLTVRPGGTSVATHIIKMQIMRPSVGSYIHGIIHSNVDYGHHMSMVQAVFDYDANGGKPDSIRINPTNGGSAYQGMIRIWAKN